MEVPKMKARIHEALRRRHNKEDEGFTLIELLVVILIIAILAAVGIVALLSALDSGKKSAAKTSLRSSMSAVKSVQVGAGSEDFSGLGVGNAAKVVTLNAAEPDLTFQAAELASGSETNTIFVIEGATVAQLFLGSRDSSGNCFYVKMNTDAATEYASFAAGSGACVIPATGTFVKSQKDGWTV